MSGGFCGVLVYRFLAAACERVFARRGLAEKDSLHGPRKGLKGTRVVLLYVPIYRVWFMRFGSSRSAPWSQARSNLVGGGLKNRSSEHSAGRARKRWLPRWSMISISVVDKEGWTEADGS